MSDDLVDFVVDPPPELTVAALLSRAARHALDESTMRLTLRYLPRTQIVSHLVVMASVDLEIVSTTPKTVADVLRPIEADIEVRWTDRAADDAPQRLAKLFAGAAYRLLAYLP